MTIRAHCAFLNASRDIYTIAAIASREPLAIVRSHQPAVFARRNADIGEITYPSLFGSTAQGEVNDDVKKRTLDLYLAFQSQDPLEVPLISEREPRWIDKDSRRNWRKRMAKKKTRLCERGRWTSEILPSGGPNFARKRVRFSDRSWFFHDTRMHAREMRQGGKGE